VKRLLVVCTGNICRSPLAEAWFRDMVPGLTVESAGTGALVGNPAEPDALDVGRTHGHDLSKHKARQIEATMLTGADLVLVMEESQRKLLRDLFPWATGKIWRLGHESDEDVPDPYRQGRASFEDAFQTISRMGRVWLPLLRTE
jgi:protein-tyrosine phosphatase